MSVPTTDSWMYRTMHRQPDDVRRLLGEGWGPAGDAAGRIGGARCVYVVGIGTSYHAALVGAWLLRAAGADARAVDSFDFARYPTSADVGRDDAVIVMAHSGVKTYSSESLERASRAGATVISVGSLTAEHPGSQLVLRTVERERSAAFTSSHLAAMTVLAQVATVVGEERGAEGVAGFRDALGRLPEQLENVLAREDDIVPVARQAVARLVYAAGAGPSAVTALEAVIKAREAAYGHIDALPVEQFLHGPIVTVNAEDLGILINVAGPGEERIAEVARVLAAIGTPLWVVGQAIPGLEVTVFPVPETVELISPLLTVVPVQLLAYHMAVLKGLNPDTFRRDNPTYAAAFGLLKL